MASTLTAGFPQFIESQGRVAFFVDGYELHGTQLEPMAPPRPRCVMLAEVTGIALEDGVEARERVWVCGQVLFKRIVAELRAGQAAVPTPSLAISLQAVAEREGKPLKTIQRMVEHAPTFLAGTPRVFGTGDTRNHRSWSSWVDVDTWLDAYAAWKLTESAPVAPAPPEHRRPPRRTPPATAPATNLDPSAPVDWSTLGRKPRPK